MTRLVWGAAGERFYEAGLDRVVLYSSIGVTGTASPWNGVTSINERIVGGDPKPVYNDGKKVSNLLSVEEFEATLQAFSAPSAFAENEGRKEVFPGLFVTGQTRKSFGLSYRTRIGNDIDGVDRGYKIHFIYGAMATPSERSNQTLGDSLEPMELSWDIVTTPIATAGFRDSSHYILDTTKLSASRVRAIEELIYGTPTTDAQLPTPAHLKLLMASGGLEIARNSVLDPRIRNEAYWNTASGTTRVHKVDQTDGPNIDGETIDSYLEYETVTASSYFFIYGVGEDGPIRDPEDVLVSFYIRSSVPLTKIECFMYAYSASGTGITVTKVDVRSFTVGTFWTQVWGVFRPTQKYRTFRPALSITADRAVGHKLAVTGVFAQRGASKLQPYFDGDFEPYNGVTYEYVASPNSSASVARSWSE